MSISVRALALSVALAGLSSAAHAETPPWDANRGSPISTAGPAPAPQAPAPIPAAGAAPGAAPSSADSALMTPHFAGGIHVGSNGIGINGSYLVNAYFTVRASLDWAPLNYGYTQDQLSYRARAKWFSAGAFADFHPFQNGWLISAGVLTGQRRVEVSATPATSRVINGVTYTPAQIGSVTGKVDLGGATPVVGVGYDSSVRVRHGLTYRFLAGAMFNNPTASLTATGTAATTANLTNYLQQQQDLLRHNVQVVKVYPMLEGGLGYSF